MSEYNNELHLLKYSQTNKFKKEFSHWALLLKYNKHLNDTREYVYHVHKSDDRIKFEMFTFHNSNKIIQKEFITNININPYDFEDLCRNITNKYDFNLLTNNCQNWCIDILNELNIQHNLKATNENCTCLYMIKISAASEHNVKDEIKSDKFF